MGSSVNPSNPLTAKFCTPETVCTAGSVTSAAFEKNNSHKLGGINYFNFVVNSINTTKLSQRRVINILHENVFFAELQIKYKISKFTSDKYCKYKL